MRRHYGLLAHKSFSDINPDPNIVTVLENLYENVENSEFYPGAVVEEPAIETSPDGTHASSTIRTAILSRIPSLVWSSRFHTIYYTPHHLTAFVYDEASSDPSIAGGGILYKLLMRALRESQSLHFSKQLTYPSWMVSRELSLRYVSLYYSA